MKQAIKSILAFAVIILCGGAWADRVISFNICQPGTGGFATGEITGDIAQSTIVGDIPTSAWTQGSSSVWLNTGITMANVYDTETQQTTSKQALLSWNAPGASNYGRPSSGSITTDHQYMWCWLGKKDNTGSASTFVIDQVPFACYDVYLYFSGTDTTANAALTVNGKTYTVGQDGTPIVGNESWGNASSSSAALGANVVKFSGMTGRFSFARATDGYGLAAVQIVEVSSTTAFAASPATDTALLDSNYLDTGFAVESIDSLLDYNFTGIMSGSYVGGTIAPTDKHYRPASAYNARKVGDSVYVEYQTYDNQTKVVLVEFKLMTADGADHATVHAKAVGVAFTTENAVGAPYMVVAEDGTVSLINGSKNVSGNKTVPLATTNSADGYGVRSIVATPVNETVSVSNTDKVTGSEGYGNWNLGTLTISAGASGFPAGTLLKVKSISVAAYTSGGSPSNKIRLNGVESATKTTPGGTSAGWQSTQGYEVNYSFPNGVVVEVGASHAIESINDSGTKVTTRLCSRPSFSSDDYKIIKYDGENHWALCVIDAEKVSSKINIAVLNNCTAALSESSIWVGDAPSADARVALSNSGDSVVTVETPIRLSQLTISGSGSLTLKNAEKLKFLSINASGLTGLTLEYDCTGASFEADEQLKSFIKSAGDNVKFVIKGSGSNGFTADLGGYTQTLNTHIVFDGGTHTFKVHNNATGSGYTQFATNGSDDNPTLWVKSGTLNFHAWDASGWNCTADNNGVVRVNDGATLNIRGYNTSNTFFWSQRLYLEPGSQTYVYGGNNQFRINGGVAETTPQIYVPASNGGSALLRSINLGYFNVGANTKPGFGIYVGEGSTLNLECDINDTNGNNEIAKFGPGIVNHTGQTPANGYITVNTGMWTVANSKQVNKVVVKDDAFVGLPVTSAIKTLEVQDGGSLAFPAGHAESTAYTLCTTALTATPGAADIYVGSKLYKGATLTYDTSAKTVQYTLPAAETTYVLTEEEKSAAEALNYGGVMVIKGSSNYAANATITNLPEGCKTYTDGGSEIKIIKITTDADIEAKLNRAALHFDASVLTSFTMDAGGNVMEWANLGSDTTRTKAAVSGENINTSNVSPILKASEKGVYLDFGAGGSHMDLGWQRLENIKTVIQVIDLVHDGNKGFFLGDWNNNNGTYGFHRGDNAQYLNTQYAKADYVYDNGVSKERGADCPTGMRVLTMGETGSDNIASDCFSHDRNQNGRNGARKLCETVVFTTALTDSERAEIEDYLLRKWFNAKAVVGGVPMATIQEALEAVEGNYANVHTLVEPTEQEIPEGWFWRNGTFARIYAMIGTTAYASIDDAVAALNGAEGNIKVVVKATSLTAAPAGANYTLTYTKGAGTADSRVVFPYEGGTVTLSSDTEEDVYYTRESISGTATTINLTNAIVNYSDIFGVGQATYVIGGTSKVTAPRFILSQGANGRTASVTIKDSAVVTITGNNDNHSNQATVMIGHWNGPSTLTIQDNAKLVVPNAGIHIGQTGNTQTINLNGGTLEAKGITMADYSATSKLNLAGGTLKLGEMGIDKYADKVLTITMTADTTIEATAATFPLEQAISVPADKTLTFTSSTLTTLDISNITLATGAALDLSGCTALVSVPVGMKEDVASVPFSQITMPDGAAYAVTPTHAEYANGSLVVANVLEDVNLKVQLPGEDTLGEMTREGTTLTYKGDIKISGYATSFDATFVHFSDDTGNPDATNTRGTLDYQELAGTNMQYDHNPTFVNYEGEGDAKVATKNTGIKMKAHPYIQSIADSWWTGTRQLTLAVVGTMPSEQKTIFIHMGDSNDGKTGLLLATGEKEDEVVVAWNNATTINEITRLSVPNAATARHVYIVTKNDDSVANTTTFTVYLDGMKWKTLEITPLFTIKGGVQVGSDFGGRIRNANVWHAANGESGIVNAIRLYGRVITDAEIAQYSKEAEYPYHSPKGSSARTFEAGAANWVAAEGTPWSNLAKDATVAVKSGSALDGSSIEATLSGAAEITVNVAEAGIAYEALNVKGSGTASFVAGENSGAIRVTGVATIGKAITVKPSSLDISTAVITLAGDGAIAFDYSTFNANAYDKETKISLTGEITQDDTKVTCKKPSVDDFHTVAFGYDSANKKYVLTIGLVAVDPEDPPVIEPENIPETWKDVPEVEGQGGRYFVENEDGKLEIKEGTPANGLTSYESYVLQLDPEDEASKPVVSAEQDASATTITIIDNITVREGKTATRKLKIGTTADNCAEVEADYNDGFTVELPSGVDKVKFIKIEYVIQ